MGEDKILLRQLAKNNIPFVSYPHITQRSQRRHRDHRKKNSLRGLCVLLVFFKYPYVYYVECGDMGRLFFAS